MGRGKKTIFLITILILLVIGSVFFVYQSYKNKPFKNIGKNETIQVVENDTITSILDKLDENNKIRNRTMLKVYTKLNPRDETIKVGLYDIKKSDSIDDFMGNLTSGKQSENVISVTIPEGFTIEDIAKRLDENGITKEDDFLNAVKSYPLPQYVKNNPEKRYQLEGYLFPDTYFFIKGEKPENIVKTFVKGFESVMKKNDISLDNTDLEKIITIASVIEKEARLDEERPIIASVINNRTKIGMKLQIDATTIYALGKHKNVVTLEDIKVASPYNTYYIDGLPIGPIASPGIESIKAAMNPADTNYIFYVYNNDNTHFFTDNYGEFERKKAENGY